MKTKNTVRYFFNSSIKGYLIFVGVLFGIVAVGALLCIINGSEGGLGGIEFSTTIFMLIIGIMHCREDFAMCVQNGVSRRTYYIASIIAFVLLAAIASAGDMVLSIVGNFCQAHTSMYYGTTYEQIFLKNASIQDISDYISSYLLDFSFNIMAISAGFLISSIFARLSRILKIVVIASFYILIFVILPYIDAMFNNASLIKKLIRFFIWMFSEWYHATLALIIGAAVLCAFAYLFVRKVQIQDRKQ